MNQRILTGLIAVVLTTLSVAPERKETESDFYIKITAPAQSGERVGTRMEVKGVASLPPGHHLWVFARHQSFDRWWPQGEGTIDPNSGEWSVLTYFGLSRDIGDSFDIAVAVFTEKEHIKLQNAYEHSLETDTPILMPDTVAPPRILRVLKVSHED